jgi:hypothetical protein
MWSHATTMWQPPEPWHDFTPRPMPKFTTEVRFYVIITVKLQVRVFWVSVVEGYLWRCRQHGPLKCWYPTTTLHGITTQKTSTRMPPNQFHPPPILTTYFPKNNFNVIPHQLLFLPSSCFAVGSPPPPSKFYMHLNPHLSYFSPL